MPQAFYDEMESPIGPLVLCASEQGLCRIDFGSYAEVKESLHKWCKSKLYADTVFPDKLVLREAVNQLEQYFAGSRMAFTLPLDMRGTSFQQRVWNALRQIPFGESRSYLQISQAIGSPKAVRAVGGANHNNPLPIVVPCHRVIGANGELVGYGGGLPTKRFLLELEGWRG
ncbi:methylated-DNA--[protein]-cysteine S-methyltransferase [Paenibacillus sp. J2TS4]|uniref:methylated-DNA--[protein]-cysteine S-methyltransferase n=1 Tax=Paenibacillus sp. J2TS4 TaxID=2807194 RepID=UPI001B18666B|nr:methylated-DNA--[protein]-cysteine S-methyltransferase [Paenibacillus sp. J2TS4]GIP34736.1 methylated-DNA--protein-cysteine methyltransferase [Paenibacillus sp. J2TS4]